MCRVPHDTAKLAPIALPAHPDNAAIAKAIGWQVDPSICPQCGGFYLEPLLDFTALGLVKPDDTEITADEVSFYPAGRTLLRGHVRGRQPGQQFTADKAYVYRDAKTGKITKIVLTGNVSVRRAGQLLIGKRVVLYPAVQQGSFHNAIYRLARDKKQQTVGSVKAWYGINAWGTAEQINQQRKGVYDLRNVSYGTCPPTVKKAWRLYAEHLVFDQNTGKGKAYNAVMKIGKLPVAWLPYISFSTNNQRKSGFLMPMIGASKRTGADITLPYYLNLAPNYDATLLPRWLSKRGVMLGAEFRFLTQKSHGHLSGAILPYDRKFKRDAKTDPMLKANRDFRAAYSIQDHTQWSPYWSGWFDVNGVSDDNYFKDFSNNIIATTQRQLVREGGINYQDPHWHFHALVQHYQTLQPTDSDRVNDVYSRLPQISLAGYFPQLASHIALHLFHEFTYFSWPQDNKPDGQRYLLTPELSLPFTTTWGFIKPAVMLHFTHYQISKQIPSLAQNINRTLPIVHVDAGLYFDRLLTWFGHRVKQTLEPHLYYLWVPFDNQDAIPLFDTGLTNFDFAQLFRPNRFSGNDRIGDANQLSAALTTHIVDQQSGKLILTAGIGDIFYFQNRRIGYCAGLNCSNPANVIRYTDPTESVSPLVSYITWHLTQRSSLLGQYAWDFSEHATNNASISWQYVAPHNHIFNVNYRFQRTSLAFDVDGKAKRERLQQVGFSYGLPINQHWSAMGFWSYNISFNHPQTYFFGLQYDSCCWALRVLGGRTLTSENDRRNPKFNNGVYLQLVFKGLATVQHGQARQLLSTNIPGYIDDLT